MSTNNTISNQHHVQSRNRIRWIAQVGMLSAVATVLMLFEIPLPFAPAFYKLDFSEIPVMVGCFAMGPAAGAMIELIKILLHVLLKGSMTGGVGDVANFVIGCCLCVPAGILYKKMHTRHGAEIGMAAGTVCMTLAGCVINAYILLPLYSRVLSIPLDALVAMGTEINSSITGIGSFVILAVAPFNLVKGILVSVIVFLIYKKISPILKISRG
ncbi:MAG TPA: ECF transporter S component [Lachnospiraceae bacterium]|nr:ECF transporter S component [Lachnospiraceae bacterium]